MAQYFKIKERRYQVVNGPSRSEIFDAAQYAYDNEKHFTVKFTTDDGHTFRFKPVSIEHEDTSGHSFNISGYVEEGYLPIIGAAGGNICELYYHTRIRDGLLTVPGRIQAASESHEERQK